ncbi:MAG: ferredoxin reductase family protein [Candidatus Nanopelagicales bacterium]
MTLTAADHRSVHEIDIPPARVDSLIRVGSAAFLWATLTLVGFWWAADGGIQDLTSWESGLNSLGRIAGLVASDLLLIQVLLIARIPLLERAFGQDRVVRMHRVIGLTSFNLMVVHIVANTWGYAGGELLATPATFWDLTTNYPGMLLAVAGALCLVMVVVTSVRIARRRLRYESWHLLHLYAYLGVGLALPHQLWTGQQFLHSTLATVYWWTFWAVAAGSVVIWRIALPLWRSARHRVRVVSVVPEGDGVSSVYLTGSDLANLPAESGQFFNWRFLGRKGWTRGNPYSLSAAPDGRSLRISVKSLGDGSSEVAHLRSGTKVLLEGPYGRLTARARTRRKVAFIGAGVGIAPLRALAESMDYAPGEAIVLYRFTDRALFEREFAVLGGERGLQVVLLPGSRRAADSWLGRGNTQSDDVTALRDWVPDIDQRDLFVCGPQVWADCVKRAARAAGVPEDQFHVESFGW